MVMQSLRRGSSGGFLKYILFGLLGMSVGGLVLMDVTGVFKTGGLGGSDVAKIEGKNISIQQFDRNVRQSLARYNISAEQAYELGLIDELLSGEIRSTYLMIESEKMGIKLGKEHIAKRIAEVVKPQMNPDETMQNALDRMLTYQRMPEKDFVSSVEREATGNIIMDAIQNAMTPPQDALAKALYQFQKQTRNIEFVEFKNNEIIDFEKPSEAQIEGLYDSLKNQKYKTPEYRSAEIIVFDPKNFDVEIEITEKEIEATYKNNKESYAVGEQYFITQIMTNDEDTANKIYEEVQNGKSLIEISKSSLGKNGRYVENVPFETNMMLPEFYGALSAIKIGETTKPFKTILGFHVTQIVEIREPEIPPLANVKQTIEKELSANKKADALYNIVASIDNQLSEGLSYAEAKESNKDAEIITTDLMTIDATSADGKNQLEDEFDTQSKALIVQTLFENEGDESSPILELDDGKFVSIKMTKKQNTDFVPLDDVKEEIMAQYISDIQNAENETRVRKFLAEAETGNMQLKELAKNQNKSLQSLYDIGISGEIAAPLKQDNLPAIFKAIPEHIEMIEIDGGYALFNISDFNIPDVTDADMIDVEKIKASLVLEAQNEAFLLYLRKLNDKYVAKINKPLLDQVYGPKGTEN
ncbi:MAG: peptidylprolyl isomerase [Alphaproteobacteria bacterium]